VQVEFPLDEYRTPIDVDTLCESVLELAESTISGILHLGSTNSKNRYEIAFMFAEKAGLNKNLILPIPHVVPTDKAPRHKNGILNTQKAQLLLKTKFLSVEQFIEKSLNNL
jgi:dTDP-4-dehydrorhamnose reductase